MLCAEAERLPLRAACADAVVVRMLLHHCLEFEPLLSSVRRILRPGGHLLALDATLLPEQRAEEMNTALAAAGLPTEPRAGIDPEELAAMLTSLGFQVRDPLPAGTATLSTSPYTPETYDTPAFLVVARWGVCPLSDQLSRECPVMGLRA